MYCGKQLKLAKENSVTIKIRHAKVMVCGASKTGKTSFTNLLRNKHFEKVYRSTSLANSRKVLIKQKISVCETDWTDLNEQQEYQEIIQRLLSKLNKQDVKPVAESGTEFSEANANQKSNETPNNQNLSNKPILTKLKKQHHIQDDYSSTTDEIEDDELVDIERYMISTDHITIPKELLEGHYEKALETWDMLTLIDTGGQPELINMLPAVNTSAAINFIVFDLSDGVNCLKHLVKAQSSEESYKEHVMKYTNLDLLNCLLSFIKTSARKKTMYPELIAKTHHKSGVCFIGTHADQLIKLLLDEVIKLHDGGKEEESSAENKDQKSYFTNELDLLLMNLIKSQKVVLKEKEIQLINSVVKKSFNDNIDAINQQIEKMVKKINKDQELDIWSLHNHNLIAVDNTTAGKPQDEKHVAEIIRSRIFDTVKKLQYEIPVVWFILELQLRHEKEVFISLDKVQALSDRIMSKDQRLDKLDIKRILNFFHALGSLMYFDETDSIVSDYVITEPQWLFKTLTDLVNCTSSDKILDGSILDAFKNKGILYDELLDSIDLSIDDQDIGMNCDDAKKNKRKLFLELLKHLKIIAPTDYLFVGEHKVENDQCYFMPSVLPTCTWINERDRILPEHEFGKQVFYRNGKKEFCLQVEPLLIKFTYDNIPRGFLCFLAVQLHKNYTSWRLYPSDTETNLYQFNNLITFRVGEYHYLALIDRTFYLELQVRVKHEEDINPRNFYFEIQSAVTNALKDICDDFNSQFTDLRYGFRCTKCPNHFGDHLTLLCKDKPFLTSIPDNYSADCGRHATKLEDKHKVWFNVCTSITN